MSVKKLFLFLMVMPLFNDIILYKGVILVTLPKLLLFPVLYLLIIYFLKDKKFYYSRLELKICLCLILLMLFNFFTHKFYTDLSSSIVQSLISGIIYMIVLSSFIIHGNDINNANTRTNLLFLLKIINFCALINGIIGIIQSVTGEFYFTGRKFIAVGSSFYRAQGLMNDPNYFGQMMVLCVFISIYLFNIKRVFLYGFTIIVLSINILLCGSRSTLLIALVSLVLFLFLVSKNKINFIKYLFIILVIYSILSKLNLLPSAFNYLTTIFDKNRYSISAERNSLKDRYIVLQEAIYIGRVNWYKGIGAGNFPYFNSAGMLSHNTLIEMFVEYGIWGVIIFGYLFINIPIRLLVSSGNTKNGRIILIGVFGYILMSFTIVTYYSRLTFLLLTLLIVLQQVIDEKGVL